MLVSTTACGDFRSRRSVEGSKLVQSVVSFSFVVCRNTAKRATQTLPAISLTFRLCGAFGSAPPPFCLSQLTRQAYLRIAQKRGENGPSFWGDFHPRNERPLRDGFAANALWHLLTIKKNEFQGEIEEFCSVTCKMLSRSEAWHVREPFSAHHIHHVMARPRAFFSTITEFKHQPDKASVSTVALLLFHMLYSSWYNI